VRSLRNSGTEWIDEFRGKPACELITNQTIVTDVVKMERCQALVISSPDGLTPIGKSTASARHTPRAFQLALLLRCQTFAGGAFSQIVFMRCQYKPIGAANGTRGWYVNCTRRRARSA
jgi:hypothetical protein